jgi:hypothetical protein
MLDPKHTNGLSGIVPSHRALDGGIHILMVSISQADVYSGSGIECSHLFLAVSLLRAERDP